MLTHQFCRVSLFYPIYDQKHKLNYVYRKLKHFLSAVKIDCPYFIEISRFHTEANQLKNNRNHHNIEKYKSFNNINTLLSQWQAWKTTLTNKCLWYVLVH